MTEIFNVNIEIEDTSGQWWEPELAKRIQELIESANDDLKIKSIKAKWNKEKMTTQEQERAALRQRIAQIIDTNVVGDPFLESERLAEQILRGIEK